MISLIGIKFTKLQASQMHASAEGEVYRNVGT